MLIKTQKKQNVTQLRLYSEMARLPENERDKVMCMLMGGASVNDVARHFGCTRQTINTLTTQHRVTGSAKDRLMARSHSPPRAYRG